MKSKNAVAIGLAIAFFLKSLGKENHAFGKPKPSFGKYTYFKPNTYHIFESTRTDIFKTSTDLAFWTTAKRLRERNQFSLFFTKRLKQTK